MLPQAIRLVRFLGILSLICASFVLVSVSQAQSNVVPIAKLLIRGGANIRALAQCDDSTGSPSVVYAIGQLKDKNTSLYAVDPSTRRFLGLPIPNAVSPALTEISPEADAIGLALSPDCRTGYTAGFSDGNIYGYRLPDPAAIARLKPEEVVAKPVTQMQACNGPEDLALARSVKKLYVACSRDNALQVLDLETAKKGPTIPVGTMPRALALYTQGTMQLAYTANFQDNTISIIDLSNNSVTQQDVCSGPSDIAADPSHPAGANRIYLTCQRDDTLLILDLQGKKIAQISVCDSPRSVVMDAQGKGVFVVCGGSDDNRSGIVFVTDGSTRYFRTEEQLDRYALVLCFTNHLKCDLGHELWGINHAQLGEINLYNANGLVR
jgi:YVTN family beta-propeller protein